MIRLIRQILRKRKWMPGLQSGTTKPNRRWQTGPQIRKERKQIVRPARCVSVPAIRQTLSTRSVKPRWSAARRSTTKTDATGAVIYLEIKPSETPTTAENMSPWEYWNKPLSASQVSARLSRYVRRIGTLYDVNVKKVGYSRRPIET